jgi:hypothetical protein
MAAVNPNMSDVAGEVNSGHAPIAGSLDRSSVGGIGRHEGAARE